MRLTPAGERALLVTLGDEIAPATLRRVQALDGAALRLPGVVETVPAYCSVLVIAGGAPLDDLAAALRALRLADEAPRETRLIEVPVAYGGAYGPDLDAVAEASGVPPGRAIALHSEAEYLVYMLGFAPGFPYLGVLSPRITASRLPTPRVRVPAGSVAVAGRQTGVYPFETPGGWRLIGRTPLVIYDPQREPPATFAVGDRVRFAPITAPQYEQRAQPAPEPRPPEAAAPAFTVREGGLYTTVQDLGRRGYRRLGVPPSGAMDPAALVRANRLVGNPDGAAGIECTAPGPVLEALAAVEVAISGADLAPTVEGAPVASGQRLVLRRGQRLAFGPRGRGVWAYVAVRGGVDVPPVMGSRSTYVRGRTGGFGGRRLGRGDVLGRAEEHGRTSAGARETETLDDLPIRVVPGPDHDAFPDGALEQLLQHEHRVSLRADRSGYRLDGRPVPAPGTERISEGIPTGAIQITPAGEAIVVMRDGPTAGGYAVLAVVAEDDLPRLAQRAPGETVRFRI